MNTLSAHDVAAELRRQLPSVGVKKLHKLLYYCQGHHLAHFDHPLFSESVMAYDMGPVIAQLWWQEKNRGVPSGTSPLDSGQLNTVAYVISRYGGLTGSDLERLSHSEPPWQQADQERAPGTSVRMDLASLKAFFDTASGPDDDVSWPTREAVDAWLAGAEDRRPQPACLMTATNCEHGSRPLPERAWALLRFDDRFGAWVDLEQPSDALRMQVLEWTFTRSDDPLTDARRADGFDDLWYAVVPKSDHGDGLVVVCAYFVDPLARTVTCDNYGSLARPIR